MKSRKQASPEKGALFLIFVMTALVAGTAGALGIYVVTQQNTDYSRTLDNLANNRQVSEEELQQAQSSFYNQARVLTATGSLITGADVSPGQMTLSTVSQQVISDQAERAVNSALRSSAPLPADISAGLNPVPTATPQPTATAEPTAAPSPTPTQAGQPQCANGTFQCGNGAVICAEQVCNTISNCTDGSDETAGLCRNTSNCCVATRGCPGETGSQCGTGCCCCPYGQACNQSDWQQGCTGAPTRQILDWDDVVDALEKDVMSNPPTY